MEKRASPYLLRKIPRMVKQLELLLYKSAPSIEAYLDRSTLALRLQQVKEKIISKCTGKIHYNMRMNLSGSELFIT